MIYTMPKLRYAVIRPTVPLAEWYEQQEIKPYLLCNASLYTPEKAPIGTLIEAGQMIKDSGNGHGFGLIDGTPHFGNPWAKRYEEYFTGYTGIVQQGKLVRPAFQDLYVFNRKHERIALCLDGQGQVCVAVGDKLSLVRFGEYCRDAGMSEVINLDGGGSRFLLLGGQLIYDSERTPYNAVVGYLVEEEVLPPPQDLGEPQELAPPEDFGPPPAQVIEPEQLVLPEEAPPEPVLARAPIVCIDPGHGVETPGKRSPDGTYLEHEFNLDVGLQIRDHLQRHGVTVVMTRDDEHDVSLAERCKICNDSAADYFLSIHTNAAGNDGWYNAAGWEAYIVARGGQAEQLADKIQAIAIPLLEVNDRGVKVANYYVLRNTDCPAVLVEHGFHTDREEVERLKDPAFRALCAESDARGLLEQLGIAWIEPETAEPWYAEAQAWVIVHGISDGTRPEDAATRAEVWEMLRRIWM